MAAPPVDRRRVQFGVHKYNSRDLLAQKFHCEYAQRTVWMSDSLSKGTRSILSWVGASLRARSTPLRPLIGISPFYSKTPAPFEQRQHQINKAPVAAQNHSSSIASVVGSSATVGEPASRAGTKAPRGALSIVFTDIVKSTDIWETELEAMAAALRIHDAIIRSLIATHQGYEVKQNGDGFMLAFASAISAMQFCLDVQQQMLDQEWPEALLKLSPGKEASDSEGHVLFRGLRLRISAHWGTPVCNWNDVIQRMDYLGPVVNRAARFIQVTEGGQIVVSEDFLLELQKAKRGQQDDDDEGPLFEHRHRRSQSSRESPPSPETDLKDLECDDNHKRFADRQFEVRLLGEREFKGLTEAEKLYFIIPHALRGRLDHWPKHKHIPGSKGNIIAT